MGQQPPQLIPLAISVLFGALLGAAVVWLLLRKLAEMARSEAKSESQAEIVRLDERVSSITEDLSSTARAKRIRGQGHGTA